MIRLFFLLSLLVVVACNRSPQPSAESQANTDRPIRSERFQNTIAHTIENQSTPIGNANASRKWSASGDPIDTAKFDASIKHAERAAKEKPDDAGARSDLAQAFFERGFALTEARQYGSALGDYRRTLKFDPDHAESKKWIAQITNIYRMLKKEPPKEGDEPPPLPFKKTAG
ncbi:MAG: hypothetical protein LC730_07085 [Acidobacteria bacterium]|nr:hypothetical protein [Acidobacteriota bacterium]MCA1609201.1 hypothetical protein [Acidobacteriota bacterium]